MAFWIANILILFALCVILAGVIIPQILLISFRRKLFDAPDGRKIHTQPVPRLGGLAFMPVIFFSSMLLFGIGLNYNRDTLIDSALTYMQPLSFLSCALLTLYIVGMADDLIGIKYRAKFGIQFVCAVFMIAGGVWINNFCGILGLTAIPQWLGWPFTVLITVFIINSINLIDGIDGLASGLSSIAFLSYGVIYFLTGEYIYSLIAFGGLGVLVPFFYYNVFGNPDHQKKIFMGDTGSLTIGMLISFLSIHMVQDRPLEMLHNANMAVIAFVPLLIPCFDVVRVYGERILNHANPFMPDKRHIHHKLLQLGWSQRKSLSCIVATSLIFTVSNVLLSMVLNVNVLLFADIVLWVFVMIAINRAIIERNKRLYIIEEEKRRLEAESAEAVVEDMSDMQIDMPQ